MVTALKSIVHKAPNLKPIAQNTTDSLTRAMQRLSLHSFSTSAAQSTKKFSAKKIVYALFGTSLLIGSGIVLSNIRDSKLEEKIKAHLKSNDLAPLLESENSAAVTRKMVKILLKNYERTSLLSAEEIAHICEIRPKLVEQKSTSTQYFDALLVKGLCQKLDAFDPSCSQFHTLSKSFPLFQLFQIVIHLVHPAPKNPIVAACITKQLLPEFEKILFTRHPNGDIHSELALCLWEVAQNKTSENFFTPLFDKVINRVSEECLKSPNIPNYIAPFNIQMWPLPMRKELIKRHALLLQERKIAPTEGSKHLLLTLAGLTEPKENGTDIGLKEV